MNRYIIGKVPPCGAMDSKYFGKPEQFEKNIEKNKVEARKYRQELRNLICKDPNKINQRFHESISVLLEIKSEFNI